MRYASLLLVVVSIATVSGLPVTGPPGPGGQVPGIPGDHLENDPMERWPEFRDWFAENEYDRYQECYQEFMAENKHIEPFEARNKAALEACDVPPGHMLRNPLKVTVDPTVIASSNDREVSQENRRIPGWKRQPRINSEFHSTLSSVTPPLASGMKQHENKNNRLAMARQNLKGWSKDALASVAAFNARMTPLVGGNGGMRFVRGLAAS